ncbi:unnamed protein product, partial [Ectocarpus sp. 8 AP-2014]
SSSSAVGFAPIFKMDQEHQALRKSCDYCVRMKRGCSGGTPCALCNRRNKNCIRSIKKRSGPAKGTKYCKRKPRKIPKTPSSSSTTSTSTSTTPSAAASKPLPPSPSSSSSSSSSRATGGGASAAACVASASSGGRSAAAAAAAPRSSLPPFGGGSGAGGGTGKRGMIQALQSGSKLAASLSKKMKREGGVAVGRVRQTPPPPPPLGGGGGGVISARPGGMALPGGGTLLPPQHETRIIEDERPSPSAVGGDIVALGAPLQQQQLRWGMQDDGGASSGYGGSDRSGSSGTDASSGDDPCLGSFTATIDGFGSRRSNLGNGFGLDGGDRRFSLDAAAADPASTCGSGLPFYFEPLKSGGGGGGGGERVVAVDGPGGGNAEAEQVAAVSMMAARRTSLEEALYGACYRRASFQGLQASAAVTAPSTLAHSHHQHQPLQHHQHYTSSSEDLAWNQLLQQADVTGQRGVRTAATAAEGNDQPAGDSKMFSTSLYLSAGFGGGGEAKAAPARQQQEQQQQQRQRQQSFSAMPFPATSMLSPYDHDRFSLDGGVGPGASTTLKDLLFDNNRWSHQPPPPLNELPMMESTT